MAASQRILRAVLAPILIILFYGAWAISPMGMALEERFGLEALFKLRGPVKAPKNVVVVAITKRSAKDLGYSDKLYEWSRFVHADVVNQLTALGARFIAFDVFFESGRDQAGDMAFAKAIRESKRTLLFAKAERERVQLGAEYSGDLQTILQPYGPFKDSALATAPLILPKIPARVNRFFVRHSATGLPTLHAQLWQRQQSDQNALASLPDTLLYNFYGPPRSIFTIEIAELLQSPESFSSIIRNAVVFVGYSAGEQPDQKDGFYTAYTSKSGLDISGVELSATAYGNLVQGVYLNEFPLWVFALFIVLYGLCVYFPSRYFSPMVVALLVASVVLVFTVAIYSAFARWYCWLPLFNSVVVLTPLCAAAGMWLRSRELYDQKRRLHWAFGKYLPQEELQKLVSQKGLPASRDFHHSVCLVTDAQGYSRLSETLSPAELADLMQEYYHAIIPAIRDSGGIISDVAGDGVIALWPHLAAEKAWDTLRSAVERIQADIDQFNLAHSETPLPTRIGIHAGEIVMGHFGARDHHEFRAMGDIINTTSRIEGANKLLGTQVLISQHCVTPNDITLRNLGLYQFVGKGNPLRLFTPKLQADSILMKQFELALMQFENGCLEEAKFLFSNILEEYPNDVPSKYIAQYLNDRRMADYKKEQLKKGVIILCSK